MTLGAYRALWDFCSEQGWTLEVVLGPARKKDPEDEDSEDLERDVVLEVHGSDFDPRPREVIPPASSIEQAAGKLYARLVEQLPV